eukprot:1753113-Pleurochrysis_carterae.AAC.1
MHRQRKGRAWRVGAYRRGGPGCVCGHALAGLHRNQLSCGRAVVSEASSAEGRALSSRGTSTQPGSSIVWDSGARAWAGGEGRAFGGRSCPEFESEGVHSCFLKGNSSS